MRTKREFVEAQLRAMIASGDLPRGARVQQDELAARFNTSITPVREALRILEAEGLLVSEPHRGVRVAETDPAQQLGVYVARRLLEPFATQLAVHNISRRDLARARELVSEMKQASNRGEQTAVRRTNRDFHFLVYNRSGIPSLVSIIESIWSAFPWDTIEVLDPKASLSTREHTELLKCLEAGDIKGAGARMEAHIQRSYRDLITHLTGEPPQEDPFDLVFDLVRSNH